MLRIGLRGPCPWTRLQRAPARLSGSFVPSTPAQVRSLIVTVHDALLKTIGTL